MSETPAILLGLDAADIVLIERWASEGELPTFADLFATAAHGRMDTPASVLQASVWPSFATACNPGKHASYFLLQMRHGTNAVTRIRADHLRRRPFWTWLDGPSETAVVIDVPKVPPLPLNGVQLVEWGTTDHYWRYSTVPAALARPLSREFGPHLRKPARVSGGVAASLRLKERLLRGIATRHRLNRALLERYAPRLFVSVFSEPHLAGHAFWHYLDGHHPDHRRHPRASRALLEVYRAIDLVVGEILADYRDRADCFVFSGHGMTADYQPYSFLGDLLCRMGLTVRDGLAATARTAELRSLPQLCMRALSEATPLPVKRLVNRHLLPMRTREYLMRIKALAGIDFSRTQAFVLPTDLQGFIRLNLRGREPDGIVPHEARESLCETIARELYTLRATCTNEPIVEKVLQPRDLYRGADNLDHLPDLCVTWKNTHPVSEVRSPRYGTITVPETSSQRSGNHRLEGFWFAAGPDIDPTVQNHRGQLYDLAPTVFRLLRKPIPADSDGTPLPILTRE